MPGGGAGDHVSIYLLYWPPKTGIICIVNALNWLVVYHTQKHTHTHTHHEDVSL